MRTALALAIALLAAIPAQAASQGASAMRYVMGTLWTVEAEGPGAEEAVEAAFAEIRRLDESLSTYKPQSELSRVNRDGGRDWVPVSDETRMLVTKALALARETDGAFDPTVGPLVELWGFKHQDYKVPEAAEIAAARARVGYHLVRVREKPAAVRFDKPGMALDLGATAKGYAVDRAIAGLKAAGLSAGRVDAGGNQGVFGPPGRVWRFGVKHPREEGEVVGTVAHTGGIATAGDAERGFWQGGVRFGHILDPRTGRPAGGMLSVTVVAPTAEEADALDTPLYVMGVRGGMAWLQGRPGVAALFVEAGDQPGTYRLTATPGWTWDPDGGRPTIRQ